MKFKSILKYIGIFFLSLILFIGLYILSAFLFSKIEVEAEMATTPDVSIFILTNGVHTDIVVPIKTDQVDWSEKIRFENTLKKDTMMRYLALGWGDKGFYLETPTWADLKFKTAFNAMFGLSATAIHATFYHNLREGKDCKKINLSKDQYIRLVTYIESSFSKNESGHFENIITKANYGDNDAFYEAKGSYSLFKTCNTWANNALKACGQKACLWTPLDKGIFYHYNKSE